jgi:ferrochelatase
MKKRAIVVFNLGGPDGLSAVQPFLFNLFNDKAIINLPNPIRWIIAKIISKRRAPIAKQIYSEIGGKSPILELTRDQAKELEISLNLNGNVRSKVFISMRYWHPMTLSTANAVKDFDPDEVILLPLYPQFSTTTSGSSLKEWKITANKIKLKKPTKTICCYPIDNGVVQAQAKLLKNEISKTNEPVRILFSAHGLPKKIINGGDPYQWQVEKMAEKVAKKSNLNADTWTICYQSRVGPLEWIGPSLDEELKRASNDKIGVIILPIAFVSEHSETLVELDIEYGKLARDLNIPYYGRVPALGTHPDFISSLKKLVDSASKSELLVMSGCGERVCPNNWSCYMQTNLVDHG